MGKADLLNHQVTREAVCGLYDDCTGAVRRDTRQQSGEARARLVRQGYDRRQAQGARDRVRQERGKCEGRKSYAERDGGKELVRLARELRSNLNGWPYSLRAVAARLAERGYLTPSGRHCSASAVASMLG
jgi:hypothetical protein